MLDYRLTWTRTLLNLVGAIVNERPARWTVTEAGRSTTETDTRAYGEQVAEGFRPHALSLKDRLPTSG